MGHVNSKNPPILIISLFDNETMCLQAFHQAGGAPLVQPEMLTDLMLGDSFMMRNIHQNRHLSVTQPIRSQFSLKIHLRLTIQDGYQSTDGSVFFFHSTHVSIKI